MTLPDGFIPPYIAVLRTLSAEGTPSRTWADYRSLGLNQADVPGLIDVMVDPELNTSSDPAKHWMPLHAWRALGQLGAVEAVQPLIEQMIALDDDYLGNEFQQVMALLGPAAIPPLAAALSRRDFDPIVRGAMAEAIGAIGQAHPSVATAAAVLVAERLEHFAEHTAELNSLLVGALLDLRAVQHADIIERVMTSGPIDEQFCGDWEDVQIELGLLDQRTTPRVWRRPPDIDAVPPSYSGPPQARKRDKTKAKAKRKLAKASRRRNRR
ncbi:MAG TPA: hypothetical protein VIP11_06240 [Gemmatimonadaceae bacterium]